MKVSVRTKAGQDLPLYNKSYALVVGNGNYTNGWDPLKGAFKDVKEVATALEKHGFNVTLKTDLTKADFDTTFEAFIRNGRDEDSRLLFYYAGHGHTETLRTGDKLGYLVMVDSPMPMTSGKIDGSKNVDMESLVTQAKRIDALHVLYVFDSCFSGSILNARSIPQPPVIQDSVKYPVRQFITAGRADEPVPDYSVFKRAFLDLLEGNVDEPIPDGYITGEELGLYLKNAVSKYNPAQTPQYGKINDPNLNKGDFVFVVQQGKIQLTGTFAVTGTWSLGAESLAPDEQSAVLSLRSDPSGATVYINDIRIGRTPLTEYQIGARGHAEEAITVRLEHDGYNSEELTLKPGKETDWMDAPLPDARQEIVGKDRAKMVLTEVVSAHSGLDKLEQVKTIITKGKMVSNTPGGMMEFDVEVTIVLPNKSRVDLSMSAVGIRMSQIFNGQSTWLVMPQGVESLPPADVEERKKRIFQNNIPLLTYVSNEGIAAQCLGAEKVNGKITDVILISDTPGGSIKLFINQETKHIIKKQFQALTEQGPADREEFLDDYRDVSGVMVAFHTIVFDNGEKSAEITFSEATINAKVDESLFEK